MKFERTVAALLLFGGMLVSPPLAEGKTLERLGFEAALAMAEQNALTREEFSHALLFNKRIRNEAWRRLYLPTVGVFQTATDRASSLSGTEQAKRLEAKLDYSLYSGGRDRAGLLAAEAGESAGFREREKAMIDLRVTTADTFFLMLSSRQRLESQGLAVERAAAEVANAVRRRDIGLDPGLRVLQADLALRDEKLKQNEEANRLAQLSRQLSHLVRGEVGPTTRLEGGEMESKTAKPLDAYLAWAVDHHPGLLQAAREAERAAQEVAQRRAVHFPELLLSAGYQEDPDVGAVQRSVELTLVYRFGGHRAQAGGQQTLGTAKQRVFLPDGSGGYTGVTALDDVNLGTSSLGLTLFDHRDAAGTAESSLLQARLQHARAARRQVELREERERDIESRYGDLLLARERLAVADLRVRKSDAELEGFRKGLAAGTVRYDEMLDKRTALNRSRLEKIDTEVALKLAWVHLLGAAGMPLTAP